MATVPTITRNVAASSLLAPLMCSATSGAVKVAAVDAATIPRGSMDPTKIRSFLVRLVRTAALVFAQALPGGVEPGRMNPGLMRSG